MSAQGMTLTVLATGLQQALEKDVATGRIGFVAKEFGPNVQAWLREIAEKVTPAPQQGTVEFTGDARKLAQGIAAAAQRAGIYNGEVALSGPLLLQLLDDMAAAAKAQPQPRPPESLERRLEVCYQLALASTMPPIAQPDVPRWW